MKGFVVFLVFCVAMFFILYFTWGKALSNFNARLNKYKNKALKLVSAGSVEKDFNEAVIYMETSFFEHDGERINTDKYTFMVVDGNSMDRFG
ncbi:MAG: hypothetical protein LBS43_11645, partial [Prevotellaceae bacterium]|nr:hypothetical protein [Prevotellaceae bacterium]